MGSGKVKKRSRVQKKAGTAPGSTGTWVAWVDSCVVRSPWPSGAREMGMYLHTTVATGPWAVGREGARVLHGTAAPMHNRWSNGHQERERAGEGACVWVSQCVRACGTGP